jgi:hypothetical protein
VSALSRGAEAQYEAHDPSRTEKPTKGAVVAGSDFLPHCAPCGELKPKPRKTMKLSRTRSGSQGLCVKRQVYELTLHDLRIFPVWEFRLAEEDDEGQDESTVRPYTASGPLDPTDRMFVVRAVFTLADGSRMQGYFTPPGRGDAGLGTMQPIIVTDRGQVRFWCGTAVPSSKRLADSYELLGKDAKQVFPVQFESEVELVGGLVRGSVPGFMVLEEFQTRRTRTVT